MTRVMPSLGTSAGIFQTKGIMGTRKGRIPVGVLAEPAVGVQLCSSTEGRAGEDSLGLISNRFRGC
jgi:hypothetical protein